ncbi:hypothetical protein MNBD_PLANCTO03-101, partial [hydrothermal vent metagenome]
MNCKHCDYPLWNLRSRQCPECGVSFRPSEFRFAKNAVRYACPHCSQDYYGTGTNGHLEPRSFPCVSCGDRIDMDEMVLLPTEGVSERQTHADINPWLDTSRRFSSRWFGTLYRGACTPSWLLRSTPVESGPAKAWGFAVLSFVLVGLVMLSPIFLFLLVTTLTGNGGVGGGGMTGFFSSFLMFGLVTALVSVVGLGLWVLTTHALLKLSGPTEGGLGRTAQAICYTCAPQMCVFVPCFGVYLGWIGTIWWVVVAGIALAAAQKVSGLRAVIAIAVLPLICGVLVVGGGVLAYLSIARTMATLGQTFNPESVSVFQQPLRDAAEAGAWPAHAGELLLDGSVMIYDFTSPFSLTLPVDCVIDTTSLEVWESLPPEAQQGMVARAVAAMPPETVAHRLGDFVFTYHGIDPADPPPDLWLVVEAWDPAATGQSQWGQTEVHVLTTQGVVESFDPAMIGVELHTQNVLRASHGLEPLPDPFSVRLFGQPAIPVLPEAPMLPATPVLPEAPMPPEDP